MLRRCYRTTMQLWDDPDIEPTPVRWFWADDDAPTLSIPTPFRSRDSDREGKLGNSTPLPFLGETKFGGAYTRGANVPYFPGRERHGPDSAWRNGGDSLNGPVIETDAHGAPPGCLENAPVVLALPVQLRAGQEEFFSTHHALSVLAALLGGARLPAAARGAAAFLAVVGAGLQLRFAFEGAFLMTAALKAGLSSLPEAEATRLVALALKAGLDGLTAAEARESAALALKAGLVAQEAGTGHHNPALGVLAGERQLSAGAGGSRPTVPLAAGAPAASHGTGQTGPAAPAGLGLSATFAAVSSVPAGCIVAWPCTSGIPTGWLACDGTEVARATYPALFAALGTTWGAGNGTTTFNLPNLKYRFLLGSGNDGAGNQTMPGDLGGERDHKLTAAEMPSHTHGPLSPAVNFVVGKLGGGAALAGGAGNVDTVTNTAAAGGDGVHNNMPPYGSALWIIKA